MEKNNESNNRSRRNRNQQSDVQNRESQQRNEEHNGNRPFSGLSPNYESNYRPGEYGTYSNRNQDFRNGHENEGNRFSREGYYNDHEGTHSREWDDVRNEGSYQSHQRNQPRFNEDENQYGYNSQNEASRKDWNRLGSPSFERGDYDRASNSNSQWSGNTDNYSSRRHTDSNTRNDFFRQQNAEHRGKGPKGYTRSDERIREDVNEKLTEDGMIDAGEIEVEVRSGEVVLKGTVRSRQEKRRTEDIIDRISGVRNIENRIKIDGSQNPSTAGQYTNGLRERRGGLEYGPGAVSGMANTSATGDMNTAK